MQDIFFSYKLNIKQHKTLRYYQKLEMTSIDVIKSIKVLPTSFCKCKMDSDTHYTCLRS